MTSPSTCRFPVPLLLSYSTDETLKRIYLGRPLSPLYFLPNLQFLRLSRSARKLNTLSACSPRFTFRSSFHSPRSLSSSSLLPREHDRPAGCLLPCESLSRILSPSRTLAVFTSPSAWYLPMISFSFACCCHLGRDPAKGRESQGRNEASFFSSAGSEDFIPSPSPSGAPDARPQRGCPRFYPLPR